MSYFQEKHFGNVTPDGSATAVTLVTALTNATRVIKNIFVCNRGTNDNFSIFHSASATVTAALYYHEDISGSSTTQISCYIPIEDDGSPVVVLSGNPSNITFSAYGAEITETPFND